jgi:hypothetical protein
MTAPGQTLRVPAASEHVRSTPGSCRNRCSAANRPSCQSPTYDCKLIGGVGHCFAQLFPDQREDRLEEPLTWVYLHGSHVCVTKAARRTSLQRSGPCWGPGTSSKHRTRPVTRVLGPLQPAALATIMNRRIDLGLCGGMWQQDLLDFRSGSRAGMLTVSSER